jgi:hypothetical protein
MKKVNKIRQFQQTPSTRDQLNSKLGVFDVYFSLVESEFNLWLD